MRIIFLGPPGVGKGTYADLLSSKLSIPHISVGELLRREIDKKTQLGEKIQEAMHKGELVPDTIPLNLLKKRLMQDDIKNGFILDGFPRTIEQVGLFHHLSPIDIVIHLTLPDHILIKKIGGRRVCSGCGKTYNVADIKEGSLHLPALAPRKEGVCDHCGKALILRIDDREETVRRRLDIYKQLSTPVIAYYKKKNLVVDIIVDGSPEHMVTHIIKLLNVKVK